MMWTASLRSFQIIFLHPISFTWTPYMGRHAHYACQSFQLCLTLCKPIDCSPPGSSVRGILQARILEWVAISFSECYTGFTLRSYSHPMEILKSSPRFLQIPGSLHSLCRTLLLFPVPSELFHSLMPHIHLLLSSLQWSIHEISLLFLISPIAIFVCRDVCSFSSVPTCSHVMLAIKTSATPA